jgi:ferredoxin-type protein NapH
MRPWLWARRAVQVAALLLFAAPLLLSGWPLLGLASGGELAASTPAQLPFYGSLSSSSVGGFRLLDPFATLELIAATRTVEPSWLLAAGAVLGFYTLVGARAFCGWVCPVNLVLECTEWVRGRLGIAVVERAVPRHAKLGVAATFLLLALLTARPLFETLSPIAALGKGLLFGSFTGIAVLGAIVVAELFWARRVWCRSLCPVGGLYELAGRIGLLKVRSGTGRCTGCQRCRRVCLSSPEILDPIIKGAAARVVAGDCMRCGACVDECPEKALRLGIPPIRRKR